jgi:amino acid transporter
MSSYLLGTSLIALFIAIYSIFSRIIKPRDFDYDTNNFIFYLSVFSTGLFIYKTNFCFSPTLAKITLAICLIWFLTLMIFLNKKRK